MGKLRPREETWLVSGHKQTLVEPGLIKTKCNPAPTFSSCLPLNHHLPFHSGPNLHPDFFLLHLTSASYNHPHGAQFQRPSSGKPSLLLPLKFLNSVCASLPTPGIVLCVHNLSCTPGGQELRALQLGSPWRAPCPASTYWHIQSSPQPGVGKVSRKAHQIKLTPLCWSLGRLGHPALRWPHWLRRLGSQSLMNSCQGLCLLLPPEGVNT